MRYVVLALFSVIVVAGCIFPDGVSNGGGVVVEVFEPSFSQVYSGEPAEFRLKIRNTGTSDARGVMPKMIGLDTWGAGSTSCYVWESITGANPSIGSSGESKNCEWTFTAPDVPAGLSTTYSPMARIYYGYRSSLVKSVLFASSKELRLMKDMGQSIPAQTASQTSGPVQIDIKTETPVRFWGSMVTFPLAITLRNTGGGVVCPSASDCETGQNLNRLSLDIRTSGDISLSDCEVSNIDLWQGKENTLVCQATFTGVSDQEIVQRTITVNADYGYYIDKKTDVSVIKRAD